MDNRSMLSFCGMAATLVLLSLCVLPGTDGACCTGVGVASALGGNGDYCCTHSTAMGTMNYCCSFDDFVFNQTGLNLGSVIGIAIGCLAAVIIFFVICCCCCGWCTLCTCCC